MPMNALNATATRATLHCLAGCSIGEVLGMIISTALGWAVLPSIAISIVLAFAFGYALSIIPILKFGLSLRQAMKIAVISDTASIATMEAADNVFLLLVPGAMYATLDTALFWVSLGTSLVVAFLVAFPVNRWLIARGKGHAVAHQNHHSHEHVAHHQADPAEDCCEHDTHHASDKPRHTHH